jgi:hypothetical protein
MKQAIKKEISRQANLYGKKMFDKTECKATRHHCRISINHLIYMATEVFGIKIKRGIYR